MMRTAHQAKQQFIAIHSKSQAKTICLCKVNRISNSVCVLDDKLMNTIYFLKTFYEEMLPSQGDKLQAMRGISLALAVATKHS